VESHPDYEKFKRQERLFNEILPKVWLAASVVLTVAVVLCLIFVSSTFLFPLIGLIVMVPFALYFNLFGSSTFLNDLSRSLTHKHIHDVKNFKPQDKPVALILEANEDDNGALRSYFPTRLESDYQLVYKRIHDINDCVNTIRSLPNIKLIWILAHGREEAILLDKQEGKLIELSKSNLKEALSLIESIPASIPLVLHSCSSGIEEFKGSAGFAKTLSSYLPTNPIYSAEKPFSYTTISGKGRLSFKTKFYTDVLQSYLGGNKCSRRSVFPVH
jgi:hypothetical protein